MSRCLRPVLAWFLAIVGLITGADELTAQQKAAVPGEQAQQASQKAASEVYGRHCRQTETMAPATELTAKFNVLKRRQRKSRGYGDALAVLGKNPTDPAANLAAGRHLCFAKGDWDRGLPMLVLGNNAELKAVATKDLAGANSAVGRAVLGDDWWALAEKELGPERDTLRVRAGFWYRQALGDLTGLARLKVQKRIDQLSGEMPKAKAGEPVLVGESHCFDGVNCGVFSRDGRRVWTLQGRGRNERLMLLPELRPLDKRQAPHLTFECRSPVALFRQRLLHVHFSGINRTQTRRSRPRT